MSDTCRNTQTNLIYLNARSLKSVTSNVNKIRDFNAPIELSDSDIFGITETWLNSNILDSELFSDQYTVYRKDGEETVQNKRGGGILMAFKKGTISRRRADLEPDCEIMVCDLQASNAEKTALVLCYRPPSFDNEFFCTAMNNTLQAVHHEYENVCVFGDFNLNVAWNGWLDLIEQFMSATIPRVKVKPNRSHSWVDSEIRHLNHM